jgi:hypothetical protein
MTTARFNTQQYRDQYAANLQPFVAEPIVAVGSFSRRGALRDTVMGKLSPTAYWSLRARAKAKSHGLPNSVLMAVTATSVHVFAHDIKHGSSAVKGEVAAWNRSQVQVEVDQDRSNDFLTIVVEETRYEFESMRGYDFNHTLFSELLAVAQEP